MDKSEIKRLILDEGLTLTDVIDVVIDENALIGVGLISLADDVSTYIKDQIN